MDDTTPAPSQTEQDLAGALRISAGQNTRARAHILARLTDLVERRQRQLQDADASVQQGLYRAAAKHLHDAASAQETQQELQRVLDAFQ